MNICIECRRLIKLWFLFALVVYVIVFGYNIPPALIFLLASIALFSSLGFWGVLIEVFTIFIPVVILYFFTNNLFLIYLIPVTNILLFMSYRSGRIMAAVISYIYILFWCYLSVPAEFTLLNYIVIAFSIINMLIHLKGLFIHHFQALSWSFIVEEKDRAADNILSSLKEGLYESKGSIEYSNIKDADNNIVLYVHTLYSAINIKYLKELYKNLPSGSGKRAFIIYSGVFFPEMAYIPLWILLSLKGYTVMGRTYYIYSMAEIKFANIYFAAEKDMLNIIKTGISDAADGFKSAMPLYFHMLIISFVSYCVQIIKNIIKGRSSK